MLKIKETIGYEYLNKIGFSYRYNEHTGLLSRLIYSTGKTLGTYCELLIVDWNTKEVIQTDIENDCLQESNKREQLDILYKIHDLVENVSDHK
jgi:hypothetical protein